MKTSSMIAQFPYDKETPWFKNVRFVENTQQLVSCNSCETTWKGYCPLCKAVPPVAIKLEKGPKKKFPKPKIQIKTSPYHLPNDEKYGREKQFKPPNITEQTPEWLKLKLNKHEAHRTFVFERDDHKCLKCGGEDWLTVDHVIPKSWGGKNHPDNYQTLCYPCNQKKGNKNCNDYRVHLTEEASSRHQEHG